MKKYQDWWDQLPEQTKQYLLKQPIWHDRDLYRALAVGALIGFVVGFLFGFDAGHVPVIDSFRPLVG